MPGPIENRLNGEADDPSGSGIPGLWIIGGAPRGTLVVNSVEAVLGEMLVVTEGGRWSAAVSGPDRQQWRGRIATRERLPVFEVLSLRELRDQLEETGTRWGSWREVTPLVPGIDQKTELRDFDLKIGESAGALAVVANRPKVTLDVEIERVPVSVARKVPAKAQSYLASHTEDWQRLTLRGIVPKRVLAEVRRDEMSTYENQVAVTLIDHLNRYLDERIDQIRRALRLLTRVQDIDFTSVTGTHQRQFRVYSLWGQSADAGVAGSSARESLRTLERIRYEILGLKDTVLYRELRGTLPVDATLRATNLFIHDQYYRRVAQLWREWANRGAASQPLTAQQQYEEQQESSRSFEWFCMLLVVRALDQLGYRADDAAQIVERSTSVAVLRNEKPQLSLSVAWTRTGTIDIADQDGAVQLSVLPLPQALAEARGQLDLRLAEIIEAQERSGRPTLVLFPWSARTVEDTLGYDLLDDERLQTAGNDPRLGLPAGLSVMPVSTWDIDSTERVARVLRWHLTGRAIAGAPACVNLPPGEQVSVYASDWLRPEDERSLLVHHLPDPAEWRSSPLGDALERVVADAEEHESLLARLQDEFSQARKPQDRKRLKLDVDSEAQRSDKFAARREVMLQVKAEAEAAVRRTECVAQCPVCETPVDTRSSLKIVSRTHYEGRCPDCRATWGTRACGQCGHVFPTLVPGGFTPDTDDLPGWVDRALGADVLAIPCRSSGGELSFICPSCGSCT